VQKRLFGLDTLKSDVDGKETLHGFTSKV
jgi:hypothetical protein